MQAIKGPQRVESIKIKSCLTQTRKVKPVLSGRRIKRTPSIKRTVAEVPKFVSLIYFK